VRIIAPSVSNPCNVDRPSREALQQAEHIKVDLGSPLRASRPSLGE